MTFNEFIHICIDKIEDWQYIEFHLVDTKTKEVRKLVPKINGQFLLFTEAFSGFEATATLFGRFKTAILGTDRVEVPERLGHVHPRIKDKTAVFGFTDERRYGEFYSLEFSHISNDSPVPGACALIFVKRDR